MIRSQRRQQGLQNGIFLLCMQVLNFGLDRIPPATLIGVVAQKFWALLFWVIFRITYPVMTNEISLTDCFTLLYAGLVKVPWNAEEVCISAVKIIKYRDWRSFFLSNFEHGSDMHLYYNMLSFILKGSYLEPIYGTMNFVLLLVILSTGCSAMYVSLGYMLMQLTGDYGYFTTCAIGFSATLFALKVIALCEEHDRPHNVNGFVVPSKVAVWLELILIHLLVPNSSFIGHLGGILVGCLYSYTFVGEAIDNLIHAVTGKLIIHEEQFYRRRNRLFT